MNGNRDFDRGIPPPPYRHQPEMVGQQPQLVFRNPSPNERPPPQQFLVYNLQPGQTPHGGLPFHQSVPSNAGPPRAGPGPAPPTQQSFAPLRVQPIGYMPPPGAQFPASCLPRPDAPPSPPVYFNCGLIHTRPPLNHELSIGDIQERVRIVLGATRCEKFTIFRLMDLVTCGNQHKLHAVVNTLEKFCDFLRSSAAVGELELVFEGSHVVRSREDRSGGRQCELVESIPGPRRQPLSIEAPPPRREIQKSKWNHTREDEQRPSSSSTTSARTIDLNTSSVSNQSDTVSDTTATCSLSQQEIKSANAYCVKKWSGLIGRRLPELIDLLQLVNATLPVLSAGNDEWIAEIKESVLSGHEIDWGLFGLTTHSDLLLHEFLVPYEDDGQVYLRVNENVQNAQVAVTEDRNAVELFQFLKKQPGYRASLSTMETNFGMNRRHVFSLVATPGMESVFNVQKDNIQLVSNALFLPDID